MAKKQKLDLTPSGAGLNNPFAALEASGLPAGPGTPPATAPANPEPYKPSKLGRVVLRREKAHRGGKTVIVVHDFAPHIGARYIETLAGKLKAACGCGGTAKDRTIEVQGDQPGRIRTLLEQEGFRVAGVT
jgi:translation initiation factor 1